MSVNWIRYQLSKGCGVGLSMIIIEYVSFNLNIKKKGSVGMYYNNTGLANYLLGPELSLARAGLLVFVPSSRGASFCSAQLVTSL